MSVKVILPAEQRLRESQQQELDAALEALLEPEQRVQRAQFRKAQYDTQLARKYRIVDGDQIDVFGTIIRGKKK